MKESEIRNLDTFNAYLKCVEDDTRFYFQDKKQFQVVPCVSCGSEQFSFQFRKMDFTYVLCDNCATLYVNPRPPYEDIIDFNLNSKSSAFWMQEFFFPMSESRRERIFRPRAELVAKRLSGQRDEVLGDIGAGPGLFLEEVKKLLPKITCVAIEPSVEMAKACQEKGFETINQAIENIDTSQHRFDFLSAFELLEHLYEPQILFRKAFDMLKEGGFFLLTTLNGEGFDIQVLWENSKNIYPPQHINFFNTRSLRKALEDEGFYVEDLATPGMLDWDIVENAIKEGITKPSRLWFNFSRNATEDTKRDFQIFLSKNRLSSHMMALARKK